MSNSTFPNRASQKANGGQIRRYKRKGPKTPLETWAILAVSVLEIALFALAFANLINEPGVLGILKLVAISLLAAIVTYTVNRFAIEKGARQAAIGFWISGAFSVISIILVGLALFISTYAGLTLKSVEEIRLAAHGSALERVIASRNKIAVQGNRPAALLRSIVADLSQHRDCELARGCISGRSAGRGPVTRYLEEKIARAESIVGEKSAGEATRQAMVAALNEFIADYRKVLADTSKDVWARRLALQKLHAKIDQNVVLLEEAQPIALLQAYADELKSGVAIPGRAQATARLNAIFRSHGERMEDILGEQKTGEGATAAFPPKTRVGETLGYFWEFLPIAMIVFATELVLPITLWLYAYIAGFWRIEREEHHGDGDDPNAPNAGPDGPSGPKGRAQVDRRDLNSDPIDGPYGYSGRWRYNERLGGSNDNEDAPGDKDAG